MGQGHQNIYIQFFRDLIQCISDRSGSTDVLHHPMCFFSNTHQLLCQEHRSTTSLDVISSNAALQQWIQIRLFYIS
ncbi:hypothetical protein PVAP13_5KG587800 [Panicum virgatum]|uniref:Uncharacterized protein n=1 Tax=Panicum virgatum TaxID=38727 RepID=A0A8T0SVT4_PANVG|nr:hypothetical protein PVAP13_5KG587800 [Panicum virgatum]